MPEGEEYARGYLKGFEDGLQEAWEDLVKLTTKGYTSRELQIMAKSKRAVLYQRVQEKIRELEKALGRPLLPETARPTGPGPPPPVTLSAGWSYLVKEDRPDRSFTLFADQVRDGRESLAIVRTHPGVLRQKFGLQGGFVWLTKAEKTPPGVAAAPAPAEKAEPAEFISPSNLARLTAVIKDFLAKSAGGIVLIEGLEYLITQNDFRSVLRFIQLINERVVLDKGILLTPLDPATMDSREFSLIEREMSTVL